MSRTVQPAPGSLRTITITRARYSRLLRGLLLDTLVSRASTGRLYIWTLIGLVASWLTGRWAVGILLVIAAVAGTVAWWWIRIRQSLRDGLGVGQTVSTSYTAWGELTVTDITGTISLSRGSAVVVTRTRDRVSVWSRTASFTLPTELLTDQDIAFLEGPGEAPADSSAPVPVLPLGLVVTPNIQARVMAAAVRVRTRSADTLFPFLTPTLLLTIVAVTRSLFYFTLAGLFLLICIGQYLQARQCARIACRSQYPLGATIRAQVTPEHLVVQALTGTLHMRWSEFTARRLTKEALFLRRDRRRPETTLVLPRELFTDDALTDLAKSVPRAY